jgi:hypothetical protein
MLGTAVRDQIRHRREVSQRMRRSLVLVVVAGLCSCVVPKDVYFRDEADHVERNRRLKAIHGASCLPDYLRADPATSVPRPDGPGGRPFAGDFDGQLEHVWLEGNTYSYSERWDAGVIGDWSLMNMGWDWKVGCRMHVCPLTAGEVCFYQECSDGGASGRGYEAPDRFGCMNASVGGQFQWFLDGLRESGVPVVEGSSPQPGP